jgi:cytochrome c
MAWCETSMPKRWLVGVVLLLMASCVVPGRSNHEQPGALGLGRPATPDDIRAWNIDANPSGEGLPLGQGTAAGGAAVYASKCARCHGPTGVEGPMDRLVGGRDTLASTSPVKTVGSYWPYATTLYDYIYRAMPFDAPKGVCGHRLAVAREWNHGGGHGHRREHTAANFHAQPARVCPRPATGCAWSIIRPAAREARS